MNPKQLVSGAVAGAIGAAVWAAVAYFANLEIGYIAWGIGGLVGIAVAATGDNTPLAGVVAVVITIASILIGKFAVVEIAVGDFQAELNKATAEIENGQEKVTDEDLQAFIASQIATAREEAGQEIPWPEVGDEESVAATYPADIWQEAVGKFAQMSAEEKEALRDERVEEIKKVFMMLGDAMGQEAVKEGFLNSFGAMDLLFFGLAVATAWGIASRDEEVEAA